MESLTTVADVLRSNVRESDKTRIIKCFKVVKDWYDIWGVEPVRGQIELLFGQVFYVYRVHYDSTLTFIKTLDADKYVKIGFA